MFTNFKDQFAINTYRVGISTSSLHEFEPWENLLFHLLVALSLALIVYAACEPYVAGDISSTLGQSHSSAKSSSTSTLNLPSLISSNPISPTSAPNPTNSTNSTNPINSSNSNFTVPSVIVQYNTVDVPSNNGTWSICSSYSVKVVDNSFPITPGYGNSTSGFSSPLVTAPVVGIIAQIRYANSLKFIPSLSCYQQFVISCDQDTGNIPIQDNENYCLDIINSTPNSQRVNVTISFTQSSVFEGGGFTSANRPGGNIEPSASTSLANIPMSHIWVEWCVCTMVLVMLLM
ncbi:17184_t:CDS:2 [Cetraspora pellucida]|uniref:17184_t:CDS:1 n=1 Tax=Cetraspora pellucida TaxID=1433469 RepID=A0ACA9KCQ3_9GLOM|nr:17184_t:CDS:2 [Cetraspora pellucida]